MLIGKQTPTRPAVAADVRWQVAGGGRCTAGRSGDGDDDLAAPVFHMTSTSSAPIGEGRCPRTAGRPGANRSWRVAFIPAPSLWRRLGRRLSGFATMTAMRESMARVAIDGGELEALVRGSCDPVALVPTAPMADELLPLAERMRGRFRVVHHRRGYAGSSPATHPGPLPRTRLTAHDCSRRSPSRGRMSWGSPTAPR